MILVNSAPIPLLLGRGGGIRSHRMVICQRRGIEGDEFPCVFNLQRIMKSSSTFLLVIVFSALVHAQALTVRVHAPGDTPDTAALFVAGNLPELGSWRPDGLRMAKGDSGVWHATLQAPKGSLVEFKITLGSWDREALYRAGVVPGNTRIKVTGDTTVSLYPVAWKQPGPAPARQVTGMVRYHRGIVGKGLRYPRDVIVWLPPSYDSTAARRYPVLYMHDGQNAFDPRTSFSGYDWQADEVADSLIRSGEMQEIIIVGIANSPDRMLEYRDTPLGRTYAEFVIRELKPMIDSVYRTEADRAHTAVMGSSLGGLISFLFVWWHPEVFSQAACLSSSFLMDHKKVVREVEAAKRLPADVRIYLDCGTAGPEGRLVPVTKQMHRLLKGKGLVDGKTLEVFVDKGAEHNERAWARRLWRPMKFLFPKIAQ